MHKQKDLVHALDVQAALKVPHRTSQLYDKVEQSPYLGPCENELVLTNSLTQSATNSKRKTQQNFQRPCNMSNHEILKQKPKAERDQIPVFHKQEYLTS